MLSKLFALAGACADLFNPINHDKTGAALHVRRKLMDADAPVSDVDMKLIGDLVFIRFNHSLFKERQLWSKLVDATPKESTDAIEAERRRLLANADELLCRAIALDALNVHLHSAP